MFHEVVCSITHPSLRWINTANNLYKVEFLRLNIHKNKQIPKYIDNYLRTLMFLCSISYFCPIGKPDKKNARNLNQSI